MTTSDSTITPDRWDEPADDFHGGRLAALLAYAVAAGAQTLRHFRATGLRVEAKADDSPVTVADREAESLIRTRIAEDFPADSVAGEEYSDQVGSSRYRWIIDPIDGTKSFVCGVPLYSTLLALECDEEPVAGVIQIPALGETVIAATGRGAWYRPAAEAGWQPARVSDKTDISEAVLLTSQTDLFARRGAGEAFAELERDCWVSRSWGDGYGYLLVATGRAELMVDAVCNPWDVAAMLPILAEAGGRFSDWRGEPTCRGGEGLGSNGKLHDAALRTLRRS
ncbi:MAG: histidinol-phosphatase [Planctomycetaceae bacterium]|nr:MAG: histidinol-phosphatase [Planctomycetaceae bacterium]